MILLDTHIWVWWVNGDGALTPGELDLLTANVALRNRREHNFLLGSR